MTTKYRLAILTSHPIQYQAPLFCKLAAHPNFDLMVYLYSNYGVTEKIDPGFGVAYKWDTPLSDGYNYKFLQNYFPRIFANGSWLLFNPGIIMEIFKERYDAVLIHGYVSPTNWLAFLSARLKGIPIIFRGESHLLNHRAWWKRIFKQIFLSQLFKRISSFLPIGSLNKAYYQYHGVPNEKMFLTPYAVDNEFFSNRFKTLNGKREQLKTEMGVAVDLPVILFASKMIPRKRAMDLLKAYEKIQERIDAALVLVGDGIERTVLEGYAEVHNLKNVHFTGFKNQTELPYYFAIADMFVLPSIDEPWGLIINEAMNFGLPIVTTEVVGAAPDLVKNGRNGFVYPVGDIEKLANCLLKLLQSPELMEKMGKCSSEIISKWGYKEDVEGILSALEYVKATKRMN